MDRIPSYTLNAESWTAYPHAATDVLRGGLEEAHAALDVERALRAQLEVLVLLLPLLLSSLELSDTTMYEP